jgi:spermidine synthase
VQDGRNHLAMTHEKYDVIISEPSNPWMSGLAKLFSREFFQLAKERLKENGIFAQWIQSYEMDWETFSLLGRTFVEVFPNGALFKVGPVDYLLLGLTDPRGLDWQHAQNHLRFARKSINVTFPGVDFLVHLILTEDLVHLFGSGPVHTDHRPYLEFAAPLKLYSGRCDMDRAIGERRRLSADTLQRLKTHRDPDTLLDLIEFSASANVPVFNLLKLCHLSDEQQARYKTVVTGYCSRVLVPSYGVFIDPKLKACCAETQIKTMRKHISLDDPLPSDHYNLALALAAADHREEAMEELRKTISMDPMHEPGYLALGLLMAEIGEFKDAAMYLENAVSLAPQKTELYKYLGMIEMQRGAYQKAISYLSRAQKHNPDDPEILGELGIAHRKLGQNEEAIALLKAALTRNPRDAETSYQLGMAFLQSGEKAKAAEQFSAAVQSDPRDKEVSP